MGDDYARKTWKEYFEDMYNVNSKVRVACLDGDEIERELRVIMMWRKGHHCWCSGDGKS